MDWWTITNQKLPLKHFRNVSFITFAYPNLISISCDDSNKTDTENILEICNINGRLLLCVIYRFQSSNQMKLFKQFIGSNILSSCQQCFWLYISIAAM